jgi:hypothetical protein
VNRTEHTLEVLGQPAIDDRRTLAAGELRVGGNLGAHGAHLYENPLILPEREPPMSRREGDLPLQQRHDDVSYGRREGAPECQVTADRVGPVSG